MKKLLLLCFFPVLLFAQNAQDTVITFPATTPLLGNDTIKIWMHIPANYPASGGGVLLGLHGLGDPNNSTEIRDYLTETSDNYNLLLVCPEPYLGQEKDTLLEKSKAVINETMDSISFWYGTDLNQTYLCGYSAGSDVAAHYTLENPEYPVKGLIWFAPGFYGSILYPYIDTAFAAPIPHICLCHGTEDMVSQSAATTVENIFSGSEVPFFKVAPQGIDHTMNYLGFTSDIATCMEFINGDYTSISKESGLVVKVYPNPTSNQLIIETQVDNLMTAEVLDLQGRLQLVEDFSNIHSKALSLKHLNAGVYLLRLVDSQGDYKVRKLVIE